MEFISSRGGGAPVSFEEALTQGIAPDGGLYIPCGPIPTLDFVPNMVWPHDVIGLLDGWLDLGRFREAIEDALSFDLRHHVIGVGGIDLTILELFHGPTASFKDVGARTMARCLTQIRNESSSPLTIITATSGDTGSAVADGFAGIPGISVVLLYPTNMVSSVQRRQMEMPRSGVTVIPINGTFDDCQRIAKSLLSGEFERHFSGHQSSSANSINVGRLIPQMLYYLWSASQSATPNTFVVPSGNLGNVTAGLLAASCNMPQRGFVVSLNANKSFKDWLHDGRDTQGETKATMSNAMDVGRPSNLERIQAMFPDVRSHVRATVTTDYETIDTMRLVYERSGYICCPHTAVGIHAALQCREEGPMTVLATASPGKFPDVVEQALGFAPPPLPNLPETSSQSIVPAEPTVEDVINRLKATERY